MQPDATIDDLLDKLAGWTDYDFIADRQTSDDLLVATGWAREADERKEPGFEWSRSRNRLHFACTSGKRPHPMTDLAAAFMLVPDNHVITLTVLGPYSVAHAYPYGKPLDMVTSRAPAATVAVCAVALKAIRRVTP